jgi:hypothetical protein
MALIKNLPIGTIVKDVNTKYYGVPINFIVLDHNHSGYPDNSTTLFAEKSFRFIFVDGTELGGGSRGSNGSNRWKFSNLRQWLNKDCLPWWVATHPDDRPPAIAYSVPTYRNVYDTEIGFLSNLSQEMRDAMFSTSYTVAKATFDGGGVEVLQDLIFLLSRTELGLGNEITNSPEGVAFSYFNSNIKRIGYYTPEAGINSYKTPNTSSNNSYWIRTPALGYEYQTRVINSGGLTPTYGEACFSGLTGLRPALNISSDTLVSDVVNEDGSYTLFSGGVTTPTSNIQVKMNGIIYTNTQAFVNVNGVWKQGEVFANVNGLWKK